MCSREIFTKKCRQQQIFDSDLKGAWHYNHVTFTPIAKNFMLYCRLIYMLSILCVRLTIKVKVGIPESFKVGWYPPKKTGSSHLKVISYDPPQKWIKHDCEIRVSSWSIFSEIIVLEIIHSFLYKNVVFPAQAEYSYFSADFRLKIFLYYS